MTHLARHMEEIALTVLPTNPDSEDGTDIDSGLAYSETSVQENQIDLDEKGQPFCAAVDAEFLASAIKELIPVLMSKALEWAHPLIYTIQHNTDIKRLSDIEKTLMIKAVVSLSMLSCPMTRFSLQ